MTEVNNELMCEVLRGLQQDTRSLKAEQGEIKQELASIRGQLVTISQDVNNIYGIPGRHDDRLDRIERRLDLHELAETQKPYEPT